MVGQCELTPWPDGFGSPENHEIGGDPPLDCGDELNEEFKAIVA